ncbi:glyoxalase/bleomycin resistance protein/dioxygenase [Streptomyces toyocaensis]|uniref:Glyoxalase/bleomycin resistance protein/dioxygenase n=1 Tax=Streptomyces toyocaensis TaxID=55952 RepID=A0A081XW32_STRTO|nr:VOC family protein [Streptomyces toyocaensis]KES07755.1 glyoxalase/bleomycin resistance protein/dioxygenase [Streptomyces toyocaensis]
MTDAGGSTRPNGEAPERHTPGTPCWVSLMVHRLDPIQEFYGALFGWEFRPGPGQLGPYVSALREGYPVAGIGVLPPDRHLPIAWTPYFASDDVNATAAAVRSCGGTVGVGPLDAGGAGRLAIGSDPGGAVFGIWQPAAHTGRAVTGAPGTPAWYELTTYESTHVAKFYETVFGHDEERTVSADHDHVTLHLAGRPVAAVHGLGHALPRDRGPHWTTFFAVVAADEAVSRVERLGGRLLEPPHDGDQGRVAVVADPEGARFAVVEVAG